MVKMNQRYMLTIHVPGDIPTIQAGLQAAVAGDTVLVAAGTYYEHDLTMNPSGIILRGETGLPEDVIIDAQGLGFLDDHQFLAAGGRRDDQR